MVIAVGTLVGGPMVGYIGIQTVTSAGGLGGAIVSAGAGAGAGAAIGSGALAGASVATGSITTAAVGGSLAAAGAGTTASFIAGSVAGGAVEGAALTIASGAASAAALEGAAAATVFAGPIGWAIIGADKYKYTWDCWKPIVMDTSACLSGGITIRELYQHPNVHRMAIKGNDLIAENIRGEQFRLSPVDVQGALAFHAVEIPADKYYLIYSVHQ